MQNVVYSQTGLGTPIRSAMKSAPTDYSEVDQNEDGVEEEYFAVERVVGKRKKYRTIQYLIKWQGYDEADNTWESIKDLDCPDLIDEYEESLKTPKPPKPPMPSKWSELSSKIVDITLYLFIVLMASFFTYMFVSSIEFGNK